MTSPRGNDERPPAVGVDHVSAAMARLAEYLSPITAFFRSEGWQRFVDGVQQVLEHPAWGAVAELAARAQALPPNLDGIRLLTLAGTEGLAAEGITIYAIPRTATARRLLVAETPQGRRQVLGSAFDSILDDCESELGRCNSPGLAPYVRMTARAIAAARDGHTEAAQALGASVVDSLLVYRYGWRQSRDLTNHKKTSTEALRSQHAVAEYMVLAPIRASYMAYWPDSDGPVPHAFARHVTAHHATPRQFSRRNVAQVIMQATALIALLSGELRRGV